MLLLPKVIAAQQYLFSLMKKLIYIVTGIAALFASFSFAFALNKPGPDADPSKLSYVFYLYYDHGQLLPDRDYEVKFDVLSESFTPQTPSDTAAFTGQIVNIKHETVQTFKFDPTGGSSSFTAGKIMVRGPYVPDALVVQFADNKGNQSVSIFINGASICNDDGTCDAGAGETTKTCSNDCKKIKATPIPAAPEPTGILGGFDLNTILIYAVGGVGVLVVAWFGWRWWKKRKEESFLPPNSNTPAMPPPLSPPPPPPTG